MVCGMYIYYLHIYVYLYVETLQLITINCIHEKSLCKLCSVHINIQYNMCTHTYIIRSYLHVFIFTTNLNYI